MRILGIDPGLIRTGYGVIEASGPERMKLIEAGIIKTSSEEGISKRVRDIYENLSDVIKEHAPSVAVLEKLYSHYKHPATSILMGHARGVVCLALGMSGIELLSLPSTRIKKVITGNGQAKKEQVQRMVKTLLGLSVPPSPFDVSDALAMAISYVYIRGKGNRFCGSEAHGS
ncbi:MAG: crossover junction endodeoxyribonuclease RuvC [Candidatus Omnitrophica bacterium]|nr:crossover junction endodeoxyribonuclease RuvC [Candidatus Omnitrophota bacterium]